MSLWQKIMILVSLLVVILPACQAVPPPPTSEIRTDLADQFQGRQGAFVLFDQKANQFIRYNPERCAGGFLPASTFKIMNAMIGLETGVIPDENYVIPWDGTQYPVKEWNKDHTLKSAVKYSVVWYFQELARRVGKDKIQHFVDAVGYGNVEGKPSSTRQEQTFTSGLQL